MDFCVRAARAGYRHLLAADLFVLRETAAAAIPHAIDEHYPGFAHAVAVVMATRSYREGKKLYWDRKNELIIDQPV